MRLPLDQLLFGRNPPAGMDWSVIGLWVCRLRKTADDCDPPIIVSAVDGSPFWRVTDGRHRTVASLIAGRTHIAAELESRSPSQ